MPTFSCVRCQSQSEVPEAEQQRELFCPRCGDKVLATAITAITPTASPPAFDHLSTLPEPSSNSFAFAEELMPPLQRELRFPGVVLPAFGSVVAQFRASRGKRWIAGIFGAFVLLLALVFFLAAMRMLFDPAEGGFWQRLWKIRIPLLLIILVLVPMGIVLLSNAFLRLDTSAVVFQDGLMLIEGKTTSTMRWDEMEVVQEGVGGFLLDGIPLVKTRRMVVVDRNGRGIALTSSLDRFVKLAEIIHEQVVARQLPRARESLSAGGPVPFGVVTIDGKGLTIDGKAMPWGEVESLRVERDCLIVRKNRNFFSLNSGDIPIALQSVPNVYVLMALATDMLKRVA